MNSVQDGTDAAQRRQTGTRKGEVGQLKEQRAGEVAPQAKTSEDADRHPPVQL